MGPNTGKLANCQPSANNAFGSIRNFSQSENCSTHLHVCRYLDIFCRKASVQEFSHWRGGHQNSFITEARRWCEVMVILVIIVCLFSFETVTRTLTKEMTMVEMLTTLLALENHGKFPGCPWYQASRISSRLPKKIIRTTPPLDTEVVEAMTSRLSTPRPVLSPASGGSRCHTS